MSRDARVRNTARAGAVYVHPVHRRPGLELPGLYRGVTASGRPYVSEAYETAATGHGGQRRRQPRARGAAPGRRAREYLAKPLDVARFRAVVEELLAGVPSRP